MQIWNLTRKNSSVYPKYRATFAPGVNQYCFPKITGSGLTYSCLGTGCCVFRSLLPAQPGSVVFVCFPAWPWAAEPQGWAVLMGVGFGGFLSADGAGGDRGAGNMGRGVELTTRKRR